MKAVGAVGLNLNGTDTFSTLAKETGREGVGERP